jgi:5-methylcytosine-specific restriction endonuclease McrA
MTNAEVLDGLKLALKEERTSLVVGLKFLCEIEKRQIHLEEGYSSLSHFCQEGLRLSRSSSLKKICASRLMARFPILEKYLREQRLHLTAIVTLSKHLTEENHVELFEVASTLSEDKLKRKLAAMFPNTTKEKISKLEWLNDEEALLTLTLPASLVAKLERLKELRKKVHPDGNLAKLLEEAVDTQLNKIDPVQRKPSTKTPKESVVHPRRIRRGIQTVVWKHDDSSCAFVSASGKRCGERAFLEVDHRVAWAHGGSSRDPKNLRLLCSGHNRFLARKTFGRTSFTNLEARLPSRRW